MGSFRRRWPGLSYGRGEDWHYVGAVGEPAFQNSWDNISGSLSLAFRIRESGIVDIQGRISGGSTTSTVFTLPEGYRPSSATWFPAIGLSTSGSNDTPVLMTVLTNGNVQAATAAVACDRVWLTGQVFLVPPDDAP